MIVIRILGMPPRLLQCVSRSASSSLRYTHFQAGSNGVSILLLVNQLPFFDHLFSECLGFGDLFGGHFLFK